MADDIGPDDRPQTVLAGAERVTQAVVIQRRANAPLKPKVIQRPCDAGLWSDSDRQMDWLTSAAREQG